MLVTLIADDLTGACDAGAMFAGRGRVPVLVGGGTAGPERSVAVVDTESRHLAPAAAAARVSAMADRLRARLAEGVLFKKIDSTLRGPVGAELDALLLATGRRQALVCPAFPAQGRTVRDGILRVHGIPAHDSGFGRDLGSGAPTSAVADIIKCSTPRPVTVLRRDLVCGGGRALARALDAAEDIAVADAETDADLDALADVALARPGLAIAGSAGLARAVATSLGLVSAGVALPGGTAWLILVGSVHPTARAQLRALEAAGVAGVTLGDSHEFDLGALATELDQQRPVFLATGDDVASGPRVEVASQLASLAARLLRRARPDAVAVTGGETAAALLRALGCSEIELLGVPGSGLALGEVSIGTSRGLPLLTKAGGFRASDLFVGLLKGRMR